MWQRKQTLYLMAAIIMTVICLCMQIGSFKVEGLEVARLYNLWYTDPLGKHHFDCWPLLAILDAGTLLSVQYAAGDRMVCLLLRHSSDGGR